MPDENQADLEARRLTQEIRQLADEYLKKAAADRRVYSITYKVLQWGIPILSTVLAGLTGSESFGATPGWLIAALGISVTVLSVVSSSLRPKEQCVLNAIWVNWFRSFLMRFDSERLLAEASAPAMGTTKVSIGFLIDKQAELATHIDAYHRGSEPSSVKSGDSESPERT